MSNLPANFNLPVLLTLHCVIGLIAAIVASRKGYPLALWLVLGLIGGTPALIAAFLVKQK